MVLIRTLLLTVAIVVPPLAFASPPPVAPPMIHLATPTPKPTRPPSSYVLELTVTTGSDDLRFDSGASIFINAYDYNHNMQSKECVLKTYNQGDSWDNNSVHTIPCPVGQTFSLRALHAAQTRIHLAEYQGAVGYARSPDNWNVERVRIEAYDQEHHLSTCILDVGGDPLVRLTSSAPDATISNYPSRC